MIQSFIIYSKEKYFEFWDFWKKVENGNYDQYEQDFLKYLEECTDEDYAQFEDYV